MVYIDVYFISCVYQYGKILTSKKKPLIKENLDTDSLGSNIGAFLPEVKSKVFNNSLLFHKLTVEVDGDYLL